MTPIGQSMRVSPPAAQLGPTHVIMPAALMATWPLARTPVGVSTVPVSSRAAPPGVTVQVSPTTGGASVGA